MADGLAGGSSALEAAVAPSVGAGTGTIAVPGLLRPRRRSQPVRSWTAIGSTVDWAVLLVASAVAAVAVRPELIWSLLVVASTSVILFRRRPRLLRSGPALLDDCADVFLATGSGVVAALAARALLDAGAAPAWEIAGLGWVIAIGLVAGRVCVEIAHRRAVAHGAGQLETLLIGHDAVARLVATRLLRNPTLGLRPIGLLSDDALDPRDEAVLPSLPRLGSSAALESVIADRNVEHVLIVSESDRSQMLRMVDVCHYASIGVSVGAQPQIGLGSNGSADDLGGFSLLHLDRLGSRSWELGIKYGVDRFVAGFLITVLSPLLLLLALAVVVESRGPVIFRQRRVGRDGETFEMLKFRTMTGDPAEAGEADAGWAIRELGTDEIGLKPADDDRVTRVGHLMRRFSLDELPQLVNVVRGEMSLIGPRPERYDYVCLFEEHVPHYGERHRVKPGITGWAQVNGLRGRTSLRERTACDNDYIAYWTPWLDLKIACLTVPAMLSGNHADE
jgi:exopolysaccharide biosynthesis polyprenyl glycosylphosphotransferase